MFNIVTIHWLIVSLLKAKWTYEPHKITVKTSDLRVRMIITENRSRIALLKQLDDTLNNARLLRIFCVFQFAFNRAFETIILKCLLPAGKAEGLITTGDNDWLTRRGIVGVLTNLALHKSLCCRIHTFLN